MRDSEIKRERGRDQGRVRKSRREGEKQRGKREKRERVNKQLRHIAPIQYHQN